MESVIGLVILAIAAFIILTTVDLIKHLIKSKRIKTGKIKLSESEQLSFKKTLKRNLILLPASIGCIILLLFVLSLVTYTVAGS